MLAFSNLYLFRREPHSQRLRQLVPLHLPFIIGYQPARLQVHRLLQHERLDVRLAAKHVLHSLLMCRLWSPDDAKLIVLFI